MTRVLRPLAISSLVVAALVACQPIYIGEQPDDGSDDGSDDNSGDGEGEGASTGGGEGEGEGSSTNAGEGEGEGASHNVGEGEGEGSSSNAGEGEGEGASTGGGAGNCQRDADCIPTHQICTFTDANNDGFVEANTCGAPVGASTTGQPCTSGAQCEHGLCFDGMCSAPCGNVNDCGIAQKCTASSYTLANGDGGNGFICTPDRTATPIACDANADCTATGRVCNAVAGTTNLTMQCGFPSSGAALGASCTSADLEAPGVCASGLCDGDVAGMCIQVCASTADCGNGLICSGSMYTNLTGANFCADPCISESQCPTGRSCQLRDGLTPGVLDTVCAQDIGTKTTGTADADGSGCQSGLLVNGKCTELCSTTANECPAAAPNCTPVNFNGQQIPVCLAP